MLDTWNEWKAKESGICPPDGLTANHQWKGTLHNTRNYLNGLFIMNIKATWITLQG